MPLEKTELAARRIETVSMLGHNKAFWGEP